ncbi:helix-turn-helix transcriptional regulator [Pseudomonas gingeri]|uniref:helix-turn-helix domain-containing protein n=1 Tax=Pseudomonas gingeri TaxID=117681 RepID=UPI00159FDDBD|nr:helix-turn-helix transcriptional regulator [Pseudomonas gingeri]NWA25388.1 helix-turn-helix transcriptional regulator [Pseudomonas gingeri]NWD68801.1 helix-turn-helix transcriptional regulator [Pseudomonas gingeri]NWD72557.1 helix-turn-helix transcriptional regulator [Pseudomonas gingeri]
MTCFAERLRCERKRLGFTQRQLAHLGGVEAGAQIHYENGQRAPRVGYLEAISEVGVDLTYLLTGRLGPISSDTLSTEEMRLLACYRGMAPNDRAALRQLADSVVKVPRPPQLYLVPPVDPR